MCFSIDYVRVFDIMFPLSYSSDSDRQFSTSFRRLITDHTYTLWHKTDTPYVICHEIEGKLPAVNFQTDVFLQDVRGLYSEVD